MKTVFPHVMVFPYPAQGHINAMLGLSELLNIAGIRVTFITTEHILHKLSNISQNNSADLLSFRAVPDGLPEDHDRSPEDVGDLIDSLHMQAAPALRRILSSGGSDGSTPVTFIVVDGVTSFMVDIGEEHSIPVLTFRTISACSFWSYFCLPALIKEGILPFNDETDLDERVQSVPGMEGFLRRRDLPSFCRVKELADYTLQLIISETQATTRYSGLILNTLEPLESEILSHIRSVIPNVYPIGPIHAFLNKSRRSSMTSLLTEDRTCMAWLDAQPPKSVVYVSFGSIATVTRDQLLEFWHGLVNSEMRFLWVLRDNLVVNADGEQETCVPSVAAYEKGRIVSWAPQLEVLGHPAIGGFLTHSGWNSTLESITVGVPMVCWPYFADQQINSRFVSDVWRVGLDMKDTCDRVTVEKMVREMMEEGERSVGMRRSASEFAEKVKSSIDEGGSSYAELQRLIHDIRSTGTAGEVS